MKQLTDEQLAEHANKIRRLVIEMVHGAKSGHPGGPLGLADIFSVLFFDILKYRSKDPEWEERDRLLISNGHVCAVRYASMALAGFLPLEELKSFRKLGSRLQGHPSTKYWKAFENSSGSLGQGLSASVGLALGARLQNKNYRVFCLISDGECGEGMTWEAAQAAAAKKVPLIAFMDFNGIQIDGFTKDVCDLGDLGSKFAAFGWKVQNVDGHNIPAIRSAFQSARQYTDGPQLIVFKTVLGKGVSFMENNPKWHGTPPNDEQAKAALAELEKAS